MRHFGDLGWLDLFVCLYYLNNIYIKKDLMHIIQDAHQRHHVSGNDTPETQETQEVEEMPA